MTDPNELLEALRAIDLTDDAAFQDVLINSMVVLRMNEQAFAAAFRVSRTTVNRWINGNSSPHPAMRKLLIESLIRRTDELRDELQKIMAIRTRKALAQERKTKLGSGSHQVSMHA